MITFLSSNTNNRSKTVFQLFWHTTMEFGIPSHVQSDKGGENMLVYHFVVAYRGPDRDSRIAGSSVHNQCIERLWRDVYMCVYCSFHEVFYFLEAQGVLDSANDCDLFVLHCVFLPVIDHHLQVFARAWNQHPICTERNWSPHKIWIDGMIDPDRRNHIAIQDVVDGVPPVPIEEFGLADEGPLADEQTHTVNIPETLCLLSNSMKEMFVHGLQVTIHINEAVAAYMHACMKPSISAGKCRQQFRFR